MKLAMTVLSVLALSAGLIARVQPHSGPASRDQSQTNPEPPDQKKAPTSVAGKWTMSLDMAMGQSTPALDLKQAGEKITGTYTGRYGTSPLEGTLKDRKIELYVSVSVDGQSIDISFEGELSADGQTMKGSASLGPAGDGTWMAKRDKGSVTHP